MLEQSSPATAHTRLMQTLDRPAASAGRSRQEEVYLGGARGRRQAVPASARSLEDRAKKALSPKAFAYVAGSAGLESTDAANRVAFERFADRPPHVLRRLRTDTRVELVSRRLAGPFLLAPIGVLAMAHRDADLAVPRAAAAEGVPMIFSDQASVSTEECAATMGLAGCASIRELTPSRLAKAD